MPYVVTDRCIGTKDLTCIDVCPVDCIYDGGAEDKMVYIDVDSCIACGACIPVCPADAIELVYDVEGTPDKVFTHLAAAWVLDRPAGRQQLEQILGERAT